ncbi:hypothetical protein ACFLYO_11355 [Chloroflexota bacterium]
MYILLILAVIFAVAAILTLMPRPSANKVCFLGYHALCTFTPISTGILAVPTLIFVVLAVIL